jgi:hypothetical protein
VSNRPQFLGPVVVVALTSLLTQCQKDVQQEPAAINVPPVASGPGSASAAPKQAVGGATDERHPEVGLGEWADAYPYKFKLTSVKRCPLGKASAQASGSGKSIRVAFTVHVLSKYDGLFVHPRDFRLEKDGVIIGSDWGAEPIAECGALLKERTMKHDAIASGVVTFQVPDENYPRSAKLVYQATRWGGAPPAETKVPDCLDACGSDATATKAGVKK